MQSGSEAVAQQITMDEENNEFLEQLPKHLRSILTQAKIQTPIDVIATPKTKLLDVNYRNCAEFSGSARWSRMSKWCKADEEDIRMLKQAATKFIEQKPVPASKLLSQTHLHITFGCKALDHCTGGGILTRGITEICGASSVGKTQILLQLSLTVQLPRELGGLSKGVVYICTEDAFPSRRLMEISKAFDARYPQLNMHYLSNIYIEHIIENEDFLDCITNRLMKLLKQVEIGLILIDSVAAIFRMYKNYVKRARDMRRVANSLMSYSQTYNCGIVCINQITNQGDGNNMQQVPCLGLSWAHLVRTRLKILREPKKIVHDGHLAAVRKLEVSYSPELPNNAAARFLITAKGVIDLPCKKN